MIEPTRGDRGKAWRYYAATAAMTAVVFLAGRGCVYEHGYETRYASVPRRRSANIARKRAAVTNQVAALWKQGRYEEAYRVAAEYQALQDEIDREVDRFERWQASQR